MGLFDQISRDLVSAMKEKNTVKVSTLRMLSAALKNKAIEIKKDSLEDKDVLTVLAKSAKQHRESIESFKKGDRNDLVEKEESELKVLQAYLPEQMSESAVLELIRKAIKKLGAQGPKATGLVMKEVMAELKGKADGRLVTQWVQSELKS